MNWSSFNDVKDVNFLKVQWLILLSLQNCLPHTASCISWVFNKTLSVAFVTLALNENYIMMLDFGGG